MDKYHIAYVLREIGTILELIDPLPMKSFAYRRAAAILEGMDDFETPVQEETLESFVSL